MSTSTSQQQPVHGWLLIDKPLGITSAHVVAKIKRLTRQKVGHAGTLDPLATGILPIAIGEATKTVSYAMNKDKSYRFTIQWGTNRATEDSEGEVTATSTDRPSEADIQAVLPQFTGKIEQIPPRFSAVKVDGKRAYALARQGVEIELKARNVEVYQLQLIKADPEQAQFEVHCSKGTYVRSLSRDICRELGVCGHISELRRIGLAQFSEEDTISLDKCYELVHNGALENALLAMDSMLDDILVVSVDDEQAKRLRFGQVIPFSAGPRSPQAVEVKVEVKGSLCAFAIYEGGKLKPKRVFNV